MEDGPAQWAVEDSEAKRRKVDGAPGRMDMLQQGPCFLKMLVTANTAGSLIGRGGSELKDLEQTHGCAIKVSSGNCFFPGTDERVVMLAGQQESVMAVLPAVVAKVMHDAHGHVDYNSPLQLKVVAMNSACSSIIGKGGGETQAVQQQTGARVSIQAVTPGLNERICSVHGVYEQCYNAIGLIFEKLQVADFSKELEYGGKGAPMGKGFKGYGFGKGKGKGMDGKGYQPQMAAAPPQQTYAPQGAPRGPSPVQAEHLQAGGPGPAEASRDCTIEFGVPDVFVGGLIGRGGEITKKIQQRTNVRIKLSEKGDFHPGTQNRRVTLHGEWQRCHSAHAELMEVLVALEMRVSGQGQ